MVEKIKYLWKYFFPDYEYLYFYSMDTNTYAIMDDYSRVQVLKKIQADLKLYKKKIVDSDLYTDIESFDAITVFTSTKIQGNVYYVPLFYELYAYLKKNKDLSVFSYKYTEINVELKLQSMDENIKSTINKTVTIYKFKIKC